MCRRWVGSVRRKSTFAMSATFEQGVGDRLAQDVVEGDRVAGGLRVATRLQEVRVGRHVLEQLHHGPLARQSRGVAADEVVPGEVDEGPPAARERVETDREERGVGDPEGGQVRVGAVAGVRRTEDIHPGVVRMVDRPAGPIP